MAIWIKVIEADERIVIWFELLAVRETGTTRVVLPDLTRAEVVCVEAELEIWIVKFWLAALENVMVMEYAELEVIP